MFKDKTGSVMLEMIIATGVAAALMIALSGLVAVANQGTGRAFQTQRAHWAAQEGQDALRTMSYDDLTLTIDGGLDFSSSQWHIVAGPDSLAEGLTRTTRVYEVMRDANCNVVASGGTVDPDSKRLETEVAWTNINGKPQQIMLVSHRTNWKDPDSECFAPASKFAEVDLSGAALYGGKQLRDIQIRNSAMYDIEIDKVIFTWTYTSSITQLFIDQKVWSVSGPGTPLGSQSSGTELDIDNKLVASGAVEISKVQFDQMMEGDTFTITLIFTDGSSVTTDPFIPST